MHDLYHAVYSTMSLLQLKKTSACRVMKAEAHVLVRLRKIAPSVRQIGSFRMTNQRVFKVVRQATQLTTTYASHAKNLAATADL